MADGTILLIDDDEKLTDDPKRPVFIKTVWGEGYLFVGKMQAAA